MAAATPSAGKGRLSPGMSAEGYKEGLKRKDGTLTKEGAVNAVNAPLDAAGKPIMFSGKDASDILGHMGLSHDAPGNKLFKNDVTGAYSELKGASHEVGGGLITTKDQDGNIARQIGDANLFKVPGGGAAIMHNTPAGRMIEPMTQLHIDKAVEVAPTLSEVDVPHTRNLKVVYLAASHSIHRTGNDFIHSRQRPCLTIILGVARIGQAGQPRIIKRAGLVTKTAIILHMYREPTHPTLLPEVKLTGNLPICAIHLRAIIHIYKEEGTAKRVGTKHLYGRCGAVTTNIVMQLHVLRINIRRGR